MNDEIRSEPPASGPPVSLSLGDRLRKWLRETALLVAGIAVLLLVAGAGFVYWLTQQRFEDAELLTGGEVTFPAGVRPAVLYFAATSGDSLVPVLRFLAEPAGPADRAVRLVRELASGPENEAQLRLLPAGAAVRHAFLDEDGRLYLDFEAGFTRGFAGGSTAEYLCLSSLVRTLAANLPEVRSLTISVAGHPVPSLGGHFPLQEELEVSQWW